MGLAAAQARQPGVQGKSGQRANRGCHCQAVCGSMTHSAGPRSPCAGGRPDLNGTLGVGMPGFAGVLRPAGVIKEKFKGNNACRRCFSTWKRDCRMSAAPCLVQSSQSTPASFIMSRRITRHRSVSASCIIVRMLLRSVVEYASSISSSSLTVNFSFSIVLPLSVSRFFPVRLHQPAVRHATT